MTERGLDVASSEDLDENPIFRKVTVWYVKPVFGWNPTNTFSIGNQVHKPIDVFLFISLK